MNAPPPTDSLDPQTLALARESFQLARQGDAARLRPLLDAGLPVNLTNEGGNTLLMLAAYAGREQATQLLLSRGADPTRANDRGQTPLAGAAFKGDLRMVELLLAGGAPVDGSSGDGRTALM
ncbi:MAG TPA: ankyrin repeat domain-containing protein, partial [Aggregicoccus sp.]|nr:ankyrin repeat domain-containing protein [Aggregicoccus sp.]